MLIDVMFATMTKLPSFPHEPCDNLRPGRFRPAHSVRKYMHNGGREQALWNLAPAGVALRRSSPLPARQCMSSNGKRRPEHYNSASRLADGPPAGNDGDPPYSRKQLMTFDAKFCAAMERAIARGLERRPRTFIAIASAATRSPR
jgi:hypothetical protein